MANLGIQQRLTDLQAVLQAAPALEDVTVSTDLEQPTADQMPFIGLRAVGWSESPRYIVAGAAAGSPDDVDVQIELACWVCSVQGTGDAVRQRNNLVDLVRNVVLDNMALGGGYNWLVLTGGELDGPATTDQGGHYALGRLHVSSRALA